MRDLSSYFKKKHDLILKKNNQQTKISNSVQDFFREFYKSIDIQNILNIHYIASDNSLIIETKNKIFANEILIELLNLRGYLKQKGIKLSKITIR